MNEGRGQLPPISAGACEILVVDDNPPTRNATSRVLRAAGYRTREAATGGQALAMTDDAVAAVILDVNLSDMNGFDVCRALRARCDSAHLPVIHLSSAHVENRDRVRGVNSGADAYMTHPADPELLVATINSLIRVRTAEESMRRSEARFRAIYEQAPDGICLLDRQGAFVDANRAMLGLLKRAPGEVLGRRVAEFAPAEWGERAREFLDKNEHGVWRGEFPLLDANGDLVYLEWSLSAQVEPGVSLAMVSNVSGRVALARQREELLAREQAARAASERLGRAKDEFAAVLSHELRAPLNAIHLWVEFLKQGNAAANLARGLEVIERNVKTQARLISDLLDVSRMAVGKLSLDFEAFDAADLVRSAVHTMAVSAQEKEIEIALDVCGVSEPVIADATRLQQIVWNLLSNAIKFSERGGRVDIRLAQDEDGLTLSVQDQGTGIAPEFQPHLFAIFSQSDSASSRRHGGLGLGLSIVKQLAELHGGTVTAFSGGQHQGTLFTVRIPGRAARPGFPALAYGAGGSERRVARRDSLAGLSIVVVEDDAEVLAVLSIILRDHGARVEGAGDYAGGLRCLATFTPDVLVSDIGLPGQDGYQLIREVRRREQGGGRRLPAIALTAFARPEDRERALAAGFDLHCAKPVHAQELIAVIKRVGQRVDRREKLRAG